MTKKTPKSVSKKAHPHSSPRSHVRAHATPTHPRASGAPSLKGVWLNRLLAICLILPFFTAIGVVIFSFFAQLSEANSPGPLKPQACVNNYAEWYTGRAQIKTTKPILQVTPDFQQLYFIEGPRAMDDSERPSAYGDPNAKHPTFYRAHQVLAWSLSPDKVKKPEEVVSLEKKFAATEERVLTEVKRLLEEGVPCPDAGKPLSWRQLRRAIHARLK